MSARRPHQGDPRRGLELRLRELPDLMFLDIQMPGLSGFDVIAQVPQSSLPIRAGRETLRLDVASIDRIDAAGDYMCLHAGGRTHVLRATIE